MRGQRLLWALVIAVAFALLMTLEVWAPTRRITHDHWLDVEKHVTRAQVEAILGRPRDCTSGSVVELNHVANGGWPPPPGCEICVWTSDTERIEVAFDESDRVVCTAFSYMDRPFLERGLNPVWLVKHLWNRWRS